MKKLAPETLDREVVPVLQARSSERAVRRLLPVELDPVDPLAEAQPSLGALVRLDSGSLVVAVYGLETEVLSLRLTDERVSVDGLHELLREIPVPAEAIQWQHPKTLVEAAAVV